MKHKIYTFVVTASVVGGLAGIAWLSLVALGAVMRLWGCA